MAWVVRMAIDFEEEFAVLAGPVQTELLANACLIARFGPHPGRPRVDTLKGSRYTNMKELRFEADGGIWRVAFAFDARREAILLACGNKAGVSEGRFYRQLIARAERRYGAHVARVNTHPGKH